MQLYSGSQDARWEGVENHEHRSELIKKRSMLPAAFVSTQLVDTLRVLIISRSTRQK